MNWRSALKKAFRKIVGWALIILSAFFFVSTFLLLVQAELGSFLTGLVFSLFVLAIGWAIQTDLEDKRKQIAALMRKYFPRCPICKSAKNYEVRGFFPASQYVRCSKCGAEWSSVDFAGHRDLQTLKLWKPPKDPDIYAEFVSQSPLKVRKSYPTKHWQALMNEEEVHLLPKDKRMQFGDLVSNHPRGVLLTLVSFGLIFVGLVSFGFEYSVGCCAVSLGTSLFITLVGFYGFEVTRGKCYLSFWATFFVVFFFLMRPT